jgi:hypothetical protein
MNAKYGSTTPQRPKKHELATDRTPKRKRASQQRNAPGTKNTRVKHRPASQLLDKLKGPARLEISHGPDRNAKSTEEREKRHHHYLL